MQPALRYWYADARSFPGIRDRTGGATRRSDGRRRISRISWTRTRRGIYEPYRRRVQSRLHRRTNVPLWWISRRTLSLYIIRPGAIRRELLRLRLLSVLQLVRSPILGHVVCLCPVLRLRLYYDYAYQYAASPAVTVVTTPEVQAAPSTIIIYNSPPGRPPAQEYREETTRAPERRSAGPLIYLIAANDGIVWAATSYRTESGVLHFVTTKGEQKQMPLSQVDRELSEQFNRERGVPFQLP
jgi:hypothetical protein